MPHNDQWYLKNTGQAGGMPGMDINVVDVWADYTGRGVTVGIFDSGIQSNHPDLAQNYRGVWETYTVTFPGGGGIGVRDIGPPDTGGIDGDNHGTAVAGIIAAQKNDGGAGDVVGVAYNSTFYSVDIWDTWRVDNPDGTYKIETTNRNVENMWRLKDYDVVNHSWDNGYLTFYANQLWDGARGFYQDIQNAAAQGRDGLGTVMVVAAGNDRQDIGDQADTRGDTNLSNFLNNRHHIVVGAVDHKGGVAPYSNPGASLLVSAFGDPGGEEVTGANGILTTDRTGADGYNDHGDTAFFSGTSAAAPQVSGVVALMLEANPNLGWRDVQDILAYSARQTSAPPVTPPDPFRPPPRIEVDKWEINGADNWNGGGLHFSNDYGFGLVDAHAAVRLAETWGGSGTSANEIQVSETINVGAGTSSPVHLIPDAVQLVEQVVKGELVQTFEIGENISVEKIELDLGIRHALPIQVEIELISPDGTRSIILNNAGGTRYDDGYIIFDRFVFTSNEFRGELSAGTWTLVVRDTMEGEIGSIGESTLRIYGSADTVNDTYIYTNEFTTSGDHGFTPFDYDGGVDTINASAVTSDTIIVLEDDEGAGHYRIAGVEGGFGRDGGGPGYDPNAALIENIIGGDGGDELTGNAVSNVIEGWRGNDRIDGRGGADTMLGGLGNDTYVIDNAGDVVGEDFRGGSDTVQASISHTLHANVEDLVLTGTAAINGTGNRRPNELTGNDARNILDGGAGADTMYGFAGNDLFWVDNAGDQVFEATGGGSDVVYATASYTLRSGAEVETLRAIGSGTTAINITGNEFVQALQGNGAANVLDGGGGADVLYGFAGNDTFRFTTALDASNVDKIVDFNVAEDTIQLDNAIFTGLAAGTLAPGEFRIGAAAADADDRIIYNNATGTLAYDADGNASGDATVFATIVPWTALTNSEFLVV